MSREDDSKPTNAYPAADSHQKQFEAVRSGQRPESMPTGQPESANFTGLRELGEIPSDPYKREGTHGSESYNSHRRSK